MIRPSVTLAAAALACAAAVPAAAADLEAETIAAWDRYVAAAEARMAGEIADGRRFLVLDFGADARAVRASMAGGRIAVWHVAPPAGAPASVPGGEIHHWRAAVFVPGVSIEGLLAALRDPAAHGYRPPDVLAWQLLERRGHRDRVHLRIQRREIVTAVFNTEHEVRFETHGGDRAASRSIATRIAEVADADAPDAREKPVGRDRGFLWRLNAYWRYEAAAGGVIVELESLSLSRSVPVLIAPAARPIISRVARESIERTLAAMRDQLGRPSARAPQARSRVSPRRRRQRSVRRNLRPSTRGAADRWPPRSRPAG